MTDKKQRTRYLSAEDIEVLHNHLARKAEKEEEPIPPFSSASQGDIDALVNIPQRSFFGGEQYSTLAEKAAILFYTVNKKQIFLNGNKRMSTLCLMVFLHINGKTLNVSEDELTEVALWVAKSFSSDFEEIKQELVSWIRNNLVDRDQ